MIKKFLKKIFKIHSPSKEWTRIPYEEKDTKCDLCDHKDQCDLLERTSPADTRRHFIPMIGFDCPLEVIERDLYLEREKVLNMNE